MRPHEEARQEIAADWLRKAEDDAQELLRSLARHTQRSRDTSVPCHERTGFRLLASDFRLKRKMHIGNHNIQTRRGDG